MSKALTRRTRRRRRSSKAQINHGKAAARRHAHPGGRTGSIHAKRTKS